MLLLLSSLDIDNKTALIQVLISVMSTISINVDFLSHSTLNSEQNFNKKYNKSALHMFQCLMVFECTLVTKL